MRQMRSGTVKFWHDRGYGFVTPDDGAGDVFLHCSEVRSGTQLAKGVRVEFADGVSERTGRPQAVRVVTL